MAARMTYELRLAPRRQAPDAVEDLSQRLMALGVAPATLAEQTIRGRRFVSVYCASRDQARRWLRRIRACGWRDARVRLVAVRAADWQDAWKRHLRPFAIAPGLRVVPAWSPEARRGPDDRRIVLETGMAFGTGKHATTRWMAEFVARLRGRFADVLDIGIGTGIVSVVAARCGARRVVGVDIEARAITVARRNLRLNGCRAFRLIHADFSTRPVAGPFDLIVANIGATPLLAMRDAMLAALRPGAHLAVTGVLARERASFRRQFDHPQLRCLRIRANRDWIALLYRRMP
jgi:ribosomal protein L11 methyltransferase